jgi:hypothetical protein
MDQRRRQRQGGCYDAIAVAAAIEVAAAIVRKQNAVLVKGGNHITHTSTPRWPPTLSIQPALLQNFPIISHDVEPVEVCVQEAHAAQEAVLKPDPVLGPLLSFFRCIISDGSVNAYVVCCFGAPDGNC